MNKETRTLPDWIVEKIFPPKKTNRYRNGRRSKRQPCPSLYIREVESVQLPNEFKGYDASKERKHAPLDLRIKIRMMEEHAAKEAAKLLAEATRGA